MEGPAAAGFPAFLVPGLGQGQGVRVHFQDRVDPGALAIQGLDPREVEAGDLPAGPAPGGHAGLEVGHGGRFQGQGAGFGGGGPGHGGSQRHRSATGQAEGQKTPAVQAGGGKGFSGRDHGNSWGWASQYYP